MSARTIGSGDEDYLPSGARRCRAKAKYTGQRCGNPAIRGGTVCRRHGGAAAQVQRAARLRLAELLDPAVATLAREMVNRSARSSERTRAAAEILDRGGLPKGITIGRDPELARELLVQRLVALAREHPQGLPGDAGGDDDIDDEDSSADVVPGVVVGEQQLREA